MPNLILNTYVKCGAYLARTFVQKLRLAQHGKDMFPRTKSILQPIYNSYDITDTKNMERRVLIYRLMLNIGLILISCLCDINGQKADFSELISNHDTNYL